jgi:Asp-tRNA(Asn)/Glu-tRNA(Gln) amidotransferase A subunit family amidase
MNDYENYDGLGLAALVRSGETSATELLDEAIGRIEAQDEALGALVLRADDDARAEIAAGLPEGPFTGVPWLLKDLHLSIPNRPLTNGSNLFADYLPDEESELVSRYRRAGLVTFGRTHSPEFGLTCTTESRLHGITRNPWNPNHTSGGSSGGASTAVSAGYLPLANASDGGGSIRIPASCCGLFGLKPSRGRTPMGPQSGEGWGGMSAVHAVTRTVRDSAALLDATAGPDLGAPYAAQPPARPWLEEVGAGTGPLRIALQTDTFNGLPTDPDCIAAARDAAALCESLGHIVEEKSFIPEEAMRVATLTLMAANTRAVLEDRAAALGRPLSPDDVEPGTWGLTGFTENSTARDYARATRTIHAVGRAFARHQREYDVVLTPTMATPPPEIGVLSLSHPNPADATSTLLQVVGFTQLSNATGCPAASVPLYWNEAGLPIGVQLIGRIDDEATLFRLSAQLEEARPWFDRMPTRS